MPIKMRDAVSKIPSKVDRLARLVGVTDSITGTNVTLTQAGSMRSNAGHRFSAFKANQTISLLRPEFVWRASTGPFGLVKVKDRLSPRGGKVQVYLLGIPIAGSRGDQITKGENMRYLAELPLAPDAMLSNTSLEWGLSKDNIIAVSVGEGNTRADVQLRLGPDGLITSISAMRPRMEDGNIIERPWHGKFSDYRWHHGRLIPFHAEVGWVVDERAFTVWRGDLKSWTIQ
jgi:hypothetical protein